MSVLVYLCLVSETKETIDHGLKRRNPETKYFLLADFLRYFGTVMES